MGQYYNFFQSSGRGVWEFPHQFGEDYHGLKLMESAGWCGNDYSDFIAWTLYKSKRCSRCANIGDYATPDEGSAHEKLAENQWFAMNSRERIAPTSVERFDYRGKVFVNKTKKEYMRLDYCYAEDWIVNPVVLLVTVGNGLGGGDFHRGKGYNRIGDWAYDLVTIADSAPEGYTDINPDNTPMFIEERGW